MDFEYVDYTRYTAAQLLEVKASINPNQAPENLKRLSAELEHRKDEISEFLNEQKNITHYHC